MKKLIRIICVMAMFCGISTVCAYGAEMTYSSGWQSLSGQDGQAAVSDGLQEAFYGAGWDNTGEGQSTYLYRSQLSDTAAALYDVMADTPVGTSETELDGLDLTLFSTKTKNFSEEDNKKALEIVAPIAQSAIDALLRDRVDIFYVDAGRCRYKYDASGTYAGGQWNWRVAKITFTFGYRAAYEKSLQSSVEKVKRVVDAYTLSAGLSRKEQVKKIHDYLCGHITYTVSGAGPYDIYGALAEGKAVCEGYARSFKILCDKFDIPCVLVSGTGLNSSGRAEKHMWDYVQMEDGDWYGVDVTWDDSGDPAVPYTDFFLAGATTRDIHFGKRTFDGTHINDGDFSASGRFIFQYPLMALSEYGAAKADYMAGDADGNGKIQVTDALVILKHVVGARLLRGTALYAADADENKLVNIKDALTVLRIVVRSADAG